MYIPFGLAIVLLVLHFFLIAGIALVRYAHLLGMDGALVQIPETSVVGGQRSKCCHDNFHGSLQVSYSQYPDFKARLPRTSLTH